MRMMGTKWTPWWVILGIVVLLRASAVIAEDAAVDAVRPEDLQFFETSIRPLLVEHCQACHGAEKPKGGLRLDSAAALRAGGESGAVVVAGDSAASLLMAAVRYEGLEMPPAGRLPAEKVALLEEWIRRGAPWPGEGNEAAPVRRTATVTDEDRQHWAFQPVRRPELPDHPPTGSREARANAQTQPLDRFIEARLRAEGMEANGRATPRALVRRAFFNLIGLPPSAEEMDHWSARLSASDAADSEAAFGELVDELLTRPQYGERWGRHWLDVVRYAQSNGYERDGEKPYAWRYRDYVIQALNNDKPYDRFVLEQLAGDELPDADASSRAATGFYRMSVWDDEPDDRRQAEFDELDDIMVSTGAAFLGLTLGCARCHDHKFDPLPQADYYRTLAFFRGVRPYTEPNNTPESSTLLPLGDDRQVREALAARERRRKEAEAKIAELPEGEERKRWESERDRAQVEGLQWTLAVREGGEQPADTQVLIRGNAGTPGDKVEPATPTVLTSLESPAAESSPEILADARSESPLRDLFPSSGRRLQFARWLTRPDHPLTARVLVNRVWHYHFGRGLVATTGDFGKAGVAPTHPELLDWLTADFVEHGWSIKHLHRTIMRSATYQRSAEMPESAAVSPGRRKAAERDPGNLLWWRHDLRRLEAEAIRDNLLAVTGELNMAMGGRGVFGRLSGELLAGQSRPGLGWEVSLAEQQRRRSVYLFVKRGLRDPLLESFDYANTTSPMTERPRTTVAPQTLMMLNGRFLLERAEALADRCRPAVGDDDTAEDAETERREVEWLYRQTLQRAPSDRELSVAIDYLREAERDFAAISGRALFQPEVPSSLSTFFREQLKPADFLEGPRAGWTYFRGAWGGSYEGIETLDVSRPPFALWDRLRWNDGIMRGRMRWSDVTEQVMLLVRAENDGDAWRGAAVLLDPRRQAVELRASPQGPPLARVMGRLPAGRWLDFQLTVRDRELAFSWSESPGPGAPLPDGSAPKGEPSFVRTDQLEPPSATLGRMGISTWGGPLQLERWEVESRGATHRVVEVTSGWERRRALVALCQVLLNSNELLYID